MPSPFCEAKGGRGERSETQGVHTPTHLNPFNSPLNIKGEEDIPPSQTARWLGGCLLPRFGGLRKSGFGGFSGRCDVSHFPAGAKVSFAVEVQVGSVGG